MGKSHANQDCRLRDVVVRIAHDTNSPWLHHHSEWELHRVLEPSFGESTEDVAMSDLEWLSACFEDQGEVDEAIFLYQQDICGLATVHMWLL